MFKAHRIIYRTIKKISFPFKGIHMIDSVIIPD